ncbi:hypothetical protein [Rhizobium sp. MHM7A]|uniref:hypothetical protein n=1 Tax=Rhizobium sp. MHM7A TaxID=2583233 RepID=UPI0011060C09|nr:hypothetical protein [Rhizobium sp. MHM7A]TLX15926.1 hypothetical protein FFR93_01010 [Rhizobium sp. MHM7A]
MGISVVWKISCLCVVPLDDILKSQNAPKEPRAVEVLKTLGALQLIRYRLVSAALQEDLDAMGDNTQSPWNDKDYPKKVARYGGL